MQSHVRISRNKIACLRKEEIALLLESIGQDTTGLKSQLELRLHKTLYDRPALLEEERFYKLFAKNDRRTSASFEEAGNASQSGITVEQEDQKSSNDSVARDQSPDSVKDTQLGSERETNEPENIDQDDDENNEDEHEESIFDKSVGFAKEQLEIVDEQARQVSKRWTKIIRKESKHALKQLRSFLCNVASFISVVRLSLSKLSIVNGLFLLVETSLLFSALFQKSVNNTSDLIDRNFEEEMIEKRVPTIESSLTNTFPFFTSVTAFFSSVSVSDFSPLLFWSIFFLAVPVTVAFFINLTLNYYSKKQQQVHHQLTLQSKLSQSVSKRTRSQTAGINQNQILAELIDDNASEPSIEEFEIDIQSPFVIDPLVFALTRFAVVYFFYSSLLVSDTFVSISAKAVKLALGNLPYFHSVFSTIIALYIVTL